MCNGCNIFKSDLTSQTSKKTSQCAYMQPDEVELLPESD